MNNKYKYLLKNIGLLTLSSFATKLLSFFLVPLYTNVLSTSEYGTYDLFNTTVALLCPVLTIDIQEAVLRFSLDEKADKRKVFSVGIDYCIKSIILVVFFLLVNSYFAVISVFNEYIIEFLLLYTTTALDGIMTYYARGIGNVKELSISSVIASVTSIILNFLFLLVLKMGLIGYFWAMIIGITTQVIYLGIKFDVMQVLYLNRKDPELYASMKQYSIPMIANAVSWWVNNASDRYVVTWIKGIAENGIYSVSYKIPSIITVFQSIFGQAWTISAVKELDREDKSGFYISIYNTYNFFMVFACTCLIFLDKIVARLLFAKDFYVAWEYAPFLLISTVFAGMSSFIGGLLSALKESKTFAQTSVITAVINTCGNIILVFKFGPIGAAIATAIAYFTMWVLRTKMIRKHINLRINMKRDLFAYLVLVCQSCLLLFVNRPGVIDGYQLIFILVIAVLFKNEIKLMLNKVKIIMKHNG